MTTAAVARLEANLRAENAWNSHVNCVISSISSARATAEAADQAAAEGRWLGLLHGATVAIKDNIDTAGTKTTMGSPFFKDNVPAKVAINEYVNVATAFFEDGDEPRFVNGALNTMARQRRPDEFA